MDRFGLHWDGEVAYQSRHSDRYDDIISDLQGHQLIYPCTCSRKELTENARENTLPDVYPGICRHRETIPHQPYALRIKTDSRSISFHDELQGLMTHQLAEQDGDFIIKRKDGVIAYQFAVVIDDELQQVNHIVRGFDLLEATPKQIFLQQLLGLATPGYMHVPVIVDGQGFKLSKQTQATAVDLAAPEQVLFGLLVLLRQTPPVELKRASVGELLDWAVAHWHPELLRNKGAVSCGLIN